MFALILGAVRTRAAQALTVLVLTALAAAAAAAGPWFAQAAAARAAVTDVAAAPAGQRTLSVRRITTTDGDPRPVLDTFAGTARRFLPVDGPPVLGLTQAMTVSRRGARAIPVAYRDGFCAHVRLTGACPARPREAALSRAAAQQIGVAPGDTLTVRALPTTGPVVFTVAGIYDLADPAGAYWSDPLYRAGDGLDPLFTPIETFTDPQLSQPTLTYDVVVPDALIRGDGGYRLGPALAEADRRLGALQLRLVNPTGDVLAAIARDRATIRRGVLVALAQVLLLAWFAIGLAGRCTGRERRGDAALLKLRGSGPGGILRLTLGQHLVPMLGGVLVGAPAGLLLALAGAGTVGPGRWAALGLSAAAVAAVLAGGLLVLALVEGAVLRLPVVALLRRVGAGRRDWRADVVDLLLLALAGAAVYQARSSGAGSGVGLIAPALVALAVALLLARVLARIADRAGGVALRTGRLRSGLAAVQVSRRPGADRVFALLVVAVAMFAVAAGGFSAARTERTDRARVELGAARVLTVQAANRTALQHAVRTADPGGRLAMAVVVDLASDPPVLAVDTPRLAAVAAWRPEYGPVGTLPGAVAAARPPAAPLITGTRLVLDARNDSSRPLTLTAVLQDETGGDAVSVPFGPIGPGVHRLAAPVAGCAPGCRIVRFAKTGAGTTVTVRSLSQQDPDAQVLGPGQLGDITRWRSGSDGAALNVSTADGTLRLSTEDGTGDGIDLPVGNEVYARDAPLPLPVVLAGPPSRAWQFTDPSLLSFGSDVTAVRVAGTAGVLPVLGARGVLTDLDAVRRVAADADLGGTYQVWLAPDAPASLVSALGAAGLTVAADDSVTARAARLGDQGPAAATDFALVTAAVGLLLAAAAVAVAAAADRGAQSEALLALRAQGLSQRSAVAAGYAGTVALAVTGLLGGLFAALVAAPVAGVQAPPFTDGWRVVAAPDALGGPPLATAGLLAALALGLTAWLAVRPLVRILRGGSR